MKAITSICLFLLIVIVFAFSYGGSESTPNTIKICLDSACTLGGIITCDLYDTNNVAIRTCTIGSKRCCLVDSVPYPATYRWLITNDSARCEGDPFYYTGGSVTINFSCNNCK